MDVDSIVIGSGAGGLTAALALARGGGRVLVLEQHYLPGGWCHSFPLGGYQFNTGVHYVGTLGPGGGLRRIYEGLLSRGLRAKLERTRWSCTGLSLFLAAEIEPAEYGLDSGNLWYFATPDLETLYDPTMDLETITGFPGMFLTVTTLKDPSKRRGKAHTLEAFVMVPWDPFARWQGSDPEARPSAYLALKARLQDAMMRTVERVIPDIRARTVFADIGTPLTHVHYCNSTCGNWYGTEKTLGQLGPRSYSLKSEVAGLYLCGASTVMHGVAGATLSGLAAAARALGVRTSELLASRGPSLRLVPAEQPEAWPEDLRAKFGGAEAEAEEQAGLAIASAALRPAP